MKNIAIASPSANAYSETFIQAHRGLRGFKVYFYSGGDLPTALDDTPLIQNRSAAERTKYFIRDKVGQNPWSLDEHLLMKSFQDQEIECVLAEYGTAGAALLPICKELSIPLIVHFHGFDASHKGVVQKLSKAYTAMFGYAHAIIAVSKKMAEDIKRLGCPEEKIHYNVYGPNPSFAMIHPTYSEPVFAGIGRFVDKKAPYYTILAFREVLRSHPDSRLVLGGDGPLLSTCKNLVRHFGMEANVDFPGILSRDQFQKLLTTATAYVQHSITAESGDSEGTPVSILEASAAGIPVISTTHAGIPDVIIHGETGLLSPEHDVTAMASHMTRLLDTPKLTADLGRSAKAHMAQHFTLERHLSQLEGILRAAVG